MTDPLKEQAPSSGPKPFALSAMERSLFGVDFDGTTLSIGVSGGRWASTIGSAALAAIIAVSFIAMGLSPGDDTTLNGLRVTNGTPLVLIGVVVLAGLLPITRALLRQRIVCKPEGIDLPGKLPKGSLHLRWDSIREIRSETGDQSSITLVSPTSVQWRANWIADYDWPLIITADGLVVEVKTLATAAASERWNPTGPSGAEQRVRLILRYHESLGIPWAKSDIPPDFPNQRRSWVSRIVAWS